MKPFYPFQHQLIEGVVVDHPNRFIMNVKIGKKVHMCHSPTTGKIGSIPMDGRPVLLSKAPNPDRKTKYTVEAFSYDRPEDLNKAWIGINQGASNRYIGYFISIGALEDMIRRPTNLASEVRHGSSRLDFLSDGIYIEVKTPIRVIEKKIPDHIRVLPKSSAYGGDRLVKHINELTEMTELTGNRTIMVSCFQYLRDPDSPYRYDNDAADLVKYRDADRIIEAFDRGEKAGVEQWIVELSITPDGVYLERYEQIH